MKNEINKSILNALTIKFGNLFSTEVLKKVAEDKSKVIADDVRDFIKKNATKGVSKSFICRQYLAENAATVKKSDTISGEDNTSDCQSHHADLSQTDSNLTGRIENVN